MLRESEGCSNRVCSGWGPGREPPGRLEGRNGAGQWKIRWVGSPGAPGQRSGVWEAPGPTRAGRLRWGWAGWPRQSQRARLRRGPGRRQGRWAAWAGLTSGFAAVAAPSSSAEAASASAPGSDRRRQQRRRPPRVGRFREGGPSRLRVRASGRRASPALSERLRPAWADTSPAAPRPESTRWTAASTAVAASAGAAVPPPSPLTVLVGLSEANANRRRVPSPLRPARPRPRACDPAPRDSSAAGEQARAHLTPTPPTARRSWPAQPRPAPARDAASEYSLRLRGHASSRPPQAAPPKLFFLTLRQNAA